MNISNYDSILTTRNKQKKNINTKNIDLDYLPD